jgi:hypothetical protein
MSLSWDQTTSSRVQKLGYNRLQDWQTNLTQGVLDGNGTAPTANTGRGKSTVSFALVCSMYHAILRTIESKGKFVTGGGWLPPSEMFEILPFLQLG